MPPKRRPKSDDTSSTTTSSNNTAVATPPSVDDEPNTKKLKVADIMDTSTTSSSQNSSQNSQKIDSVQNSNDDEELVDDDRPECWYGASCYRKNPQHHVEYRHPQDPKKIPKKKTSTSVNSSSPPPAAPATLTKKSSFTDDSPTKDTSVTSVSSVPSDVLSSYSSILQLTLAKNKISTDEKRLLRQYRKKHNISDADHFKLLKQFGWTEDEYDDGVKQDDDIELEEEHKILEAEDGFSIIRITKDQANKSKNHMNVFSKVCTKFYETMSKAQANFTVTEVGVIVNTKLKKKYTTKRLAINQRHGEEMKEEWGFHGTSRESINKIAQTGFLHPDDLKALQSGSKNKKKGSKSKPKHEKPVELLDDGYYGKGIYFTTFSDYALWYSEERESDQVLLCKLASGKPYKCTKRMDGQDCQKGYDSHISPKGNEIVIFDVAQILPRYIVTFVEKDAEEREQES